MDFGSLSCRTSESELLKKVEQLRLTPIKETIDARLKEFQKMRSASNDELFKELSFCILTANFNAERAIAIQEAIGDGFLIWSKKRLAKRLKALGYRYPNLRAGFIVKARKHKDLLCKPLKLPEEELRAWIVSNVKGLGWKEASHFLRNVGFLNFAIIDFHIVDILEGCKIVKRPKTMTKARYLEIEAELRRLGRRLGLNMAELDLYLWYLETGKILK